MSFDEKLHSGLRGRVKFSFDLRTEVLGTHQKLDSTCVLGSGATQEKPGAPSPALEACLRLVTVVFVLLQVHGPLTLSTRFYIPYCSYLIENTLHKKLWFREI